MTNTAAPETSLTTTDAAAAEILRVAVVWNFLTECADEIGRDADREGHDRFLIEMLCNPR